MSAPKRDLPKTYDPKAVEDRLYARWESGGYFHEDPDPARPPFIICMPPPNVTGRAHLGHGSTYTPQDILVRYHRMLGDNADWLPGLDHAAVATEAVLVRELAQEGLTRDGLGREAYFERAWSFGESTGKTIVAQFRKLGFGPDWARSRYTMDDGLSRAVNKVFVQLYQDGLIYRGKRLINWDPKARTTISDAEVEHVERDATLWRVRYPFEAGEEAGVVIATTRPETILADVAIAVHPDDERYRSLVGRRVFVPPLLERSIPIVADAAVDMAFGTGAVKVTPAHDATDYEIGLRHELPMPSVLDFDARVTGADVAVGRYEGLDRYEARRAIVGDLKTRGLLAAEEPYRHAIAVSERTGEVVEPLLSLQWFVRMAPLATPALDAYRDGRVRFVPERYGRTYEQWLENIRDWNISRQVWWGHRLPVWYDERGEPIVAETEDAAQFLARERGSTGALTRDPDTLDTWFSSALWPFSILGWPERTPELAHWYPSQVLVSGWEIIFLWIARMVMLGLKFMGSAPFPDVFIAPLVFDAEGRKMSKSLGNAIDPLDIVERYGADAFRMGMMRQMRLEGQEVRFHESRCEEARNFNNKIWNATRFVLALPDEFPHALDLPGRAALSVADRWILTRLHDTAVDVTAALNAYDFGNAAESIWRFVWYEFCDWYVEAAKIATSSRMAVLSFVLNHAMRLLHPIEPFITEEVWLSIPHDGATIMTALWPDPDEIPVDRDAERTFTRVQGAVERVRQVRADMGLAPRAPLAVDVPLALNDELVELLRIYTSGTIERNAQPVEGSSDDLLLAVSARAPKELLVARWRKDVER
ncbi:MAG: valine--tRNA ligase, partial [Candidatus Eremiobacteraeota bacterium]|nr:valine--tRNA ligase [Candidatus Eremiobacteraeota bacterium]